MRRHIAIAVLLCALCQVGSAVILFDIEAQQDDFLVRNSVCLSPELKPLHIAYTNIIQTRLWPLKFAEVAEIFGPRLETATNWWASDDARRLIPQHPTNLVLPSFASVGGRFCGMLPMMVSGLHSTNQASNKSHTDLYAIGDIGYVELYSQLDGQTVQTAAIYLRSDEKFLPLKSVDDFAKRLEWERGKFDALKRWFDAHLPDKAKKLSPNAAIKPP